MIDEFLLSKLQQYLNHDPEAVKFIQSFCQYCHDIDDIIDGDKTNTEHILKTFCNAAAIYSSNFYHRYSLQLYPIVLNITNTYADSVKWEKSDVDWKRAVSDTLRSCGNDMIYIVVGICSGYDAMRDVSALLREVSYNHHHDEIGKPI